MDTEKVAHDLALFYLQVELTQGEITAPANDDFSDLVSEYLHIRTGIEKQLRCRGH